MILELHNNLRDVQRIEATRVVVRDIFDNPVCVVIEHAPGQYWVTHLGEPGFEDGLAAMGLNKTVVTIEQPKSSLVLPG